MTRDPPRWPEWPEQPKGKMPEVPHAFRDDPVVQVHPGEAPYAVRIELSLMPRDWDRIQRIVVNQPTTSHRVLTSLIRLGLDLFYSKGRLVLEDDVRAQIVERIYGGESW